jgi:hypothetical protein
VFDLSGYDGRDPVMRRLPTSHVQAADEGKRERSGEVESVPAIAQSAFLKRVGDGGCQPA